jgi:hypothetical protein
MPGAEDIKRYFHSNAVIGETSRFRQLDRYEAFYATNQYAHIPYDWWGQSADQMETVSASTQVPQGFTQPAVALNVRQKRPTAPYHLAKAVVDRFTGLVFGESRKPEVEVQGDPATDDFLKACMEQMRWWPKWREARTMGGATGGALVTWHLNNGSFQMLVHNPKHVQMLWQDRRNLVPLGALIMYSYPKEVLTRDQKTGEVVSQVVDYLYRRIITTQDDTVYEEVPLVAGGKLEWVEQSKGVHGLGMFPGVWIQNKPVTECEDGEADCHGLWQTFDTIDRLISQMNKAVLLNLDPTLVVKIDPKVYAQQGGIRKGSDAALFVGEAGGANYIEITATGVEAGHKLIERLVKNCMDVSRCILLDPAAISGAAQSAKAIEYIYAPMLECADDLRAQWGDTGIIPGLRIVEAMARKFHGAKVDLPEGKKGILQINIPRGQNGQVRKLGPGGWIVLKWGTYFTPSAQDEQVRVQTTTAALSGKLIDHATAVRQTAPIFGVKDADTMLVTIEEESKKEMDQMMGNSYGELDGTPVEEPPTGEEPTPPAGEGGLP